jgi:signal transduction histidine kinase
MWRLIGSKRRLTLKAKKTTYTQSEERGIFLLKLHDIFFRKFLLLFVTIFLILGMIFYFWIRDICIDETRTDLLHNIDILSLQIDSLHHVNSLAKAIKDKIALRVTIISQEGKVLGESDRDFKTMDNHLNRAEVRMAQSQAYGSIIRYSHTLEKELLYVSKKYTINEQSYYIRMARDIEIVNQKFFYLALKIGLLFLLFMAFAFNIALKISQEVQDETKEILEFLKQLNTQTKALKIESRYSQEFNNITKLLTLISKQRSKKNLKKSKYTAKLKLSNRQKDDIISAISHEFKNPIAVISGYTQTLREDSNLSAKMREKFLAKIASNTNKLTDMIDRLRLSITLEEKKQALHFSPCNLAMLTQEIVEDLSLTYPNREIKIQAQEVNLKVDVTMMGIAISNLVENALKYSKGTISISIDQEKLTVTDTGIGLPPEELEKITEKFYRVSSNSWNNSLGLGLSLVKNIMQMHHFTLEIQSEEGKGSAFRIVYGVKNTP